jgi:hypothetical protein
LQFVPHADLGGSCGQQVSWHETLPCILPYQSFRDFLFIGHCMHLGLHVACLPCDCWIFLSVDSFLASFGTELLQLFRSSHISLWFNCSTWCTHLLYHYLLLGINVWTISPL